MATTSRIIFLDVDGVLNSALSMDCTRALEAPLLNRLARIISKTGAQLVVSSSWKNDPTSMNTLIDRCEQAGIDKSCFVGTTPTLKPPEVLDHSTGNLDYSAMGIMARVMEIKASLAELRHRSETELVWIVIDDLELGFDTDVRPHFVKTSREEGLTEQTADLAIQLLLHHHR